MKDPSSQKKRFIYPDVVYNGLALAYLILAIIITLAVLKPFGLGEPADPLVLPESVKPEWYFLAFFQFLNYLPKGLGVSLLMLGVIGFCLWPFIPIARKGNNESAKRRLRIAVGVLFLAMYILLTFIGYLADTDRVIFGKLYHIDLKGLPHRVETVPPGQTDTESTTQEHDPADSTAVE